MSPGFQGALVSFAKGTDPPQKMENEDTDAFQTRTIEWLTQELKSIRALLWVVLMLVLAKGWVLP